jgi:hypothetical protein
MVTCAWAWSNSISEFSNLKALQPPYLPVISSYSVAFEPKANLLFWETFGLSVGVQVASVSVSLHVHAQFSHSQPTAPHSAQAQITFLLP